ncbi:MATH domain and coiled-coil domain-containing protein At3g58400-like [Pistacia vera]|uniref:MATH domain and coiled-coil domain-containing protein At3g58400-like n=1 Tax=Pistacia vera TaxID=55513 RepID=UPI001263A389|nr:MATH domain and coiled-coil domain-containing protein At3g58400-like [Pistacia vera]
MDTQLFIEGNTSEGRDAPPSHYLFKIESFSLLSKAPLPKYTSNQFDAEGYKWKLSLYPVGDKHNDGEGFISIYLALVETSSFSFGWDVNVVFNFFILNQLQNRYVTVREWTERRYHAMKTEWGITKFMDLETFHNPFKGYLIDDTCVFGAEVFVVRSTFKRECLSMVKEPATCFHIWKVNNFSTLSDDYHYSSRFGDQQWGVCLHPKGAGEAKGSYISLYLYTFAGIPETAKWFVNFILRVKDQMNGEDIIFQNNAPNKNARSIEKFMLLAKLKDPKLGYLVNDTCIIEAEVTLLGMIN